VFCLNFIFLVYAMGIVGMYKNYGLEEINDDAFLSLVGSIGAVFNGLSRPLWAALYDRYGFKTIFVSISLLGLITTPSLAYVSEYKPTFFIWLCTAYTIIGGFNVLFPPINAKIFGSK